MCVFIDHFFNLHTAEIKFRLSMGIAGKGNCGSRGRSTALVVLCLPGNEGDCSSTITQFQSAETVDGAAHQFHKGTPSGIPTFTNGHLSRKATYSGPGGHSMHSPLFKKKCLYNCHLSKTATAM